MKPLVIYHGNCQDGFTSAWAIWLKHPDWEFYPGKYGEIPPDVTGRNVYMVDFSYKRSVIEDMALKAETILILDHHKTAEEGLKAPLPINVNVIFDMKKSGAMLAWEYFHPNEPIPNMIKYVQDRDLWKFEYPETKAVSSYLFSLPYDFNKLITTCVLIERNLNIIVEQGDAILRQHDKDVQELSVNKFKMNIGNYNVWAVNVPYTLCSDMAHLVGTGEPFGATFYYDGSRGKFIFSLRSDENGIDVSEVAKQYGGGGHKHAAGFEVAPSYDITTILHNLINI